MDHLQVSVLALRETIDRQEDRIDNLELQRALLLSIILFLLVAVCAVPVFLRWIMSCNGSFT